jgi:acetylornithine deacetylase/succinyl-diaminopimelate desuccinylase-like protein
MPTPNADRLVADLIGMVSIKSVNPVDDPASPGHREQEFAEYFLAKMKSLGLETDSREVVPGRPNVWGTLKGTGDGPSLMLAGHMDTVGVEGYSGAHNAHLRSGRVYGRGSVDMKAALACYLETVRLLQESGQTLPGDLIIAGVCDEEHLMLGSKDWGANGPHADFGIIGEPTSLDVCIAHKGQMTTKITTYGKAVHSSGPENGVNAVEHMGAVISALSAHNNDIRTNGPTHPLCGQGRFSMNVISGGMISSAIPDRCEIEVDRRYLPGETTEGLLQAYRDLLAPLADKIPNFRAEVGPPNLDAPPLDVPADSLVVKAIVRAAKATGTNPEITAFPASTDAPNMGFPCIVCGPGHLVQAHTIDEFVEVEQLTKATALYFEAAISL